MSKAYRDQPFGQRYHTMGDQAEDVFDAVKPLGNSTQFGFRRPKGIKFGTIPETFRHMPDRITPTYLVEVMGLGRDGILKSLKTTKYEALKYWNKWAIQGGLLGLVLFVWNSHQREFLVLDWSTIVAEVSYSKRKYGIQEFESDGNTYYRLDWVRIRAKSRMVGVHEKEVEDDET